MISFEDGLWDILLGIIFMFLAIYPVTRELLGPIWNLVLFLSLLGLMIVAQLLVRHLVSEPRIGYVRLRKTMTLRVLFIISIVMVVITFGLVLLTLFIALIGVPFFRRVCGFDRVTAFFAAMPWYHPLDEPRALDYNDYNQPGLYSSDAYRSSDHDPVIVGLELGETTWHWLYLPLVAREYPSP